MILKKLNYKQLIHPPSWLISNTQYLCQMGSVAYGVAGDNSDIDIYGFCIPPKYMVFPHMNGEIIGFGKQVKRFEQWQEHHIKDDTKEYDFSVYSIIKFFQLCMDNNPNMIDALFVPERCVLYSTPIGALVRENRKLFLHKGCWYKFKGYAYSQLHKMSTKNPKEGSKRAESIKKHGWDIKFGYHVVRLLLEVEEILATGDLHLDQNSEILKAIRRGKWKEQKVYDFFEDKEKILEKLYHDSNLPYKPNENDIKELLIKCLEYHFGNINNCVSIPDKYKKALHEIKKICDEL